MKYDFFCYITVSSQSTFVIYGKRGTPMIKGISITKPPLEVIVPITNVLPGALDYDIKTQSIYFSDLSR